MDKTFFILGVLLLTLGIALVVAWIVTWNPTFIWLAVFPLGLGGAFRSEGRPNRQLRR